MSCCSSRNYSLLWEMFELSLLCINNTSCNAYPQETTPTIALNPLLIRQKLKFSWEDTVGCRIMKWCLYTLNVVRERTHVFGANIFFTRSTFCCLYLFNGNKSAISMLIARVFIEHTVCCGSSFLDYLFQPSILVTCKPGSTLIACTLQVNRRIESSSL